MRAAWIGLICMGIVAPAAANTTRFDGEWNTFQACPGSRDSAGFNYEYTVEIRNGVLHGQRKSPGEAGYLTVDGTLADDGSAVLLVHGLTGVPAFSVGNVRPLTPFVYHVTANFGASSGQGVRTEVRPCTFTFKKS